MQPELRTEPTDRRVVRSFSPILNTTYRPYPFLEEYSTLLTCCTLSIHSLLLLRLLQVDVDVADVDVVDVDVVVEGAAALEVEVLVGSEGVHRLHRLLPQPAVEPVYLYLQVLLKAFQKIRTGGAIKQPSTLW